MRKLDKHISLFLLLAFTLPLISVILIKIFSIESGTIHLILYGFEAITPHTCGVRNGNTFGWTQRLFDFFEKNIYF